MKVKVESLLRISYGFCEDITNFDRESDEGEESDEREKRMKTEKNEVSLSW